MINEATNVERWKVSRGMFRVRVGLRAGDFAVSFNFTFLYTVIIEDS